MGNTYAHLDENIKREETIWEDNIKMDVKEIKCDVKWADMILNNTHLGWESEKNDDRLLRLTQRF